MPERLAIVGEAPPPEVLGAHRKPRTLQTPFLGLGGPAIQKTSSCITTVVDCNLKV
jgi:hypothetical protein